MMKLELTRRLLDLKAHQASGEQMPCPRCGGMNMKTPLEHNALSRYTDLYICDDCGMTEALLDMMRNPLPLDQWTALKESRGQLDSKALSMKELTDQVLSQQVVELRRLHSAWVHRAEGDRFEAYRDQALKSCPGLVDLWENPFCAVYLARDGRVLVRFRWSEGKSEIAVDTLPST